MKEKEMLIERVIWGCFSWRGGRESGKPGWEARVTFQKEEPV